MFHEVLLPDEIAYGGKFGPQFKTTVVKTGSDGEQRIAQWSRALRRGTVDYDVRSKTQIDALLAFYLARQSRLFSFRFSD